MIPYDDLVAALSAWRARQGLPVSTLGGSGAAPVAVPPAPGSGPRTAPPAAPSPRAAPPAAPPARAKPTTVPPPLAPADDALDVDAAMLEEAHYEPEGDDFAMAFNKDELAESTAIGTAPQRDTHPSVGGGNRNNNNDDW